MYKQVRNFNPSKMGTRPNWCLANCMQGFEPPIPPKYPDAKAAMQANRNAGTLHNMDTLPLNCAVPVFADTPSQWEHVMVCDKGIMYSDGTIVDAKNFTYFGWGETLNDVRIVEYVPDPEPAPEPTPAPAPEPEFKVGDKVVPINLVDYYGTPLIQFDDYYTIIEINGDRAVLAAPRGDRMEVWAAMNTNNIRKV